MVLIGALMYIVEGPEHGFTDIPTSMYWAIVTLTTVGYGDLSPQTALGKLLASVVMIIGYAIIAVPTGIVTSELTAARTRGQSRQACPRAGAKDTTTTRRTASTAGAPCSRAASFLSRAAHSRPLSGDHRQRWKERRRDMRMPKPVGS